MFRLALVPAALAVLLVACARPAVLPSTEPSPPPAGASTVPTERPAPPSAEPTVRPSPSVVRPVLTPRPTASPAPAQPTVEEQYLLDGIRRDAVDCLPVRDDLPVKAVAGIECRSDDPAVARIGFFLFRDDDDMLAAYFARMDAEGIAPDSGGDDDEEGESAYIPGEDGLADRQGRFVNAEGYANYRTTISGNHVYIGVLGRTANMRALVDFAWRGNDDVPGQPTLWHQPGG